MRNSLHALWIFVALGLAACGGGDEESEGEQLCRSLKDKVEECDLDVDTSGGCNPNPSDQVLCAGRCAVKVSCEELVGPPQDNPYYRCMVVCSGGSEEDFICADGSGFLPQEGVCDGTEQCHDGSDEAECD